MTIITIHGEKIIRLASSMRAIEQKAIDVIMQHYTISGSFRDILEQYNQIRRVIPVEFYLLDVDAEEGYQFDIDQT